MARRRTLLAIALLAALLHAVAIARTLLPAQDGLKLIRFARQFQTQPWADAVRGADVHPLYPALVALLEPAVSAVVGPGPDAWRLSAQVVAALAALGLIVPVYSLTEAIFNRRIALIAAGVLVLLPRVAEAGRETLADSLGLLATFLAIWLAARAWDGVRKGDAIASGICAGLGYLARPEVILVPAVVALAWLLDRTRPRRRAALLLMLAGPSAAFVGYAAIKGEISEKLSIRQAAGLGPAVLKRPVPQQAPRGLDDPRWDFSPKEEGDRVAIRGVRQAFGRILGRWWEGLGWFFAAMAVWGVARRRALRRMIAPEGEAPRAGVEVRLLVLFAAVYTAALLRHCTALGYLSWRHVLPLVVASIPWAAAGTDLCCRRLAVLGRLSPGASALGRLAAISVVIGLSLGVQWNPRHLQHFSRWGHWAAGRWLSSHAAPGEEVLDTRGWARFVSGLPGYDYWHVRQALTDSHLSYIIVGLDELTASSPRAETLRTLLAYAATPLADFPASPTGTTPAVQIYRFRRPASWEGLAR